MLLTLTANSLRQRLTRSRSEPAKLALTDLPRYTRQELGLYGLNISTDLLAGADSARVDALREAADRASCPCLVLVEAEPQPFADPGPAKGKAAMERMTRVVQAASRLGCNAVALQITGPDGSEALAAAADRLKRVLHNAERLEVNLLIMSGTGLSADPDRLTDLIKKIGGFRVGTFPDFQTASATADPIHCLRRLTPYASALTASSVGFKASKKPPGFVHEPYDLALYTRTVASVGYAGTLAIDYRGEGDPEIGIVRTRQVLELALATEGPEA